MADLTLDASTTTLNARVMRRMVFTSALIGYFFQLDASAVWGYRKTTDGGQTWGAFVAIDGGASAAGAGDIWFDKWNPGDTGTKIHTCWVDGTNSDVLYRSLDTASDTLGTQTTIYAGTSYASGRGVFSSIAKAISGYLYCAFDIDAGAEKGLYRSTDNGANWSLLDAAFIEASLHQCLLFPAPNTGDDNDIWAAYIDAGANRITLKEWDSSAGAANESADIAVFNDQTTDTYGQYAWSGSIRHSDGHLIVALMNVYDNSTGDHFVFDIASTTVITQLTTIRLNIDDHYWPTIFIDQTTNDLYVLYNGISSGAEVLGTASKIYYALSTDDGANWSLNNAYMEDAAALVVQVWAPIMGPRFYAAWRLEDGATKIMANYDNSIAFSAAPPGSSGRPIPFFCF